MDAFPHDPNRELSAMAFDFGTQRIGVAHGQTLSGTAQALPVLRAKDGVPDWDRIEALLREWRPDVLVVGLPYNMDGSPSELQQRAEKFANRLHGRFHKPCYGIDERLTSMAAREEMSKTSHRTARGAPIDSIAAQLILESWFNELQRRRQADLGADGGYPAPP